MSRWAIVMLACLTPTLLRAFANSLKAAPAFQATPGPVARPPAQLLVIEGADRAGAGRHAAVAIAVLIVPSLDNVGFDLQNVWARRQQQTHLIG